MTVDALIMVAVSCKETEDGRCKDCCHVSLVSGEEELVVE